MKKAYFFEHIKHSLWKYERVHLIIAFFLVFCLLIVWKMFSYTVLEYTFYKNLADNQQIWKVVVPVTRGTIYSWWNNTTILATSLNLYDIAVDPQSEWNKEKLVLFLTNIVYKEMCYLKTKDECYQNILKFLKLVEIENFTKDEDVIKKLIFDKLKERIYQEKVTSVFIDVTLTKKQIITIQNFAFEGITFINDFLYINPEKISNLNLFVDKMAPILWLEQDNLKQLARKRNLRYVPILSKISILWSEEIKKYLEDEKIAVKKWILDSKEIIGNFVIFTPNPHRFYPEKKLASQVIGFVDDNGTGHYWIEGYFDDILKGSNGKIVSRKDINGRIIDPINFSQDDLRGEGVKIYTTIDRNVQSKIESVLEQWVKEYQANNWTIVVMDPTSGKIIAMANYPSYDLNNYGDVYEIEKVKYSKYPDPKIDLLGVPVFVEDNQKGMKFFYDSKEIYLRKASEDEIWNIALVKYKYKNDFWPQVYQNDAISGLYEPGSIMKAMTVATWLDTGEIWRYDMYNDTGEVVIDNYHIKNDSTNCLWFHTFWHALDNSCNVWMIRIVQKIGKVLFYNYLNNFGFSWLTGITLYGEKYAEIVPWEKWSLAQLFTSSYGLWVSATPLHMATAYSVLANGGLYVKPRIIDRIVFPDGRVMTYKTEVDHRVISPQTSEIITSMLHSWMVNGYAAAGAPEGYDMAWKTWTAQIPKWGTYETGIWTNIASFAWFWPIQDPRFVVIVRLDRPRLWWGYGTRTSAFLFKSVTQYLLDYYGIPKKL